MRVLKEGTRLADRYTLIRRLGSGGMSRVWLAHDSRADARVALKFAASDPVDETGRELLQREWRTGSRLMHPNIARVFEFHDDPDGAFYAQQFLPGPAAGVLAGEPWKEALRPFGMIGDALRYAHGKGVVHRDVKAANILFDHRGLPYLIDFGVAAAPDVRVSGGGTPVAASPQQEAGEPPTPADDIHALGVLLHETISGRPPQRDDRSGARLSTLATADGAAVPDAVLELVDEMLAAEAERRPSAPELTRRLRDAGIEPGPAPARVLGRQQSPDTFLPVEAVSPMRRSTAASTAQKDEKSRGVPPAALWAGLSLLLVAFLGVIFWLPDAVDRNGARDGGTTAGPQPSAVTDAADPEATAADAPATADSSDGAVKAATDEILGELLSKLERLKMRGIERWGGQAYLEAIDLYEQGDRAFLDRDYRLAGERYRAAIEKLDPFFGRIDREFRETLEAAEQAFARGDHAEAVRLYDLAVVITPSHQGAQDGLERARNLERVLALTEQGLELERDLELEAARTALEEALTLDPSWQPAKTALARVEDAIVQHSFEQRMTEGLEALAAGDYPTARAAFNAAKDLRPGAQQPVDGLLQVDQEMRLASIRRLEREAAELEERERWRDAVAKYEEILEVDGDLQFAREGLANARERTAIHERLQGFIGAPDSLSAPATMQAATQLLLRVSRISPMGPRLEDQKDELSRLLKRAATPLTVQLVSDNATEVSIFQVGHLGTFARQELDLRPGAYVALGSRPGFRDVRLEFRVAPEVDMEPIVIMCEEQI